MELGASSQDKPGRHLQADLSGARPGSSELVRLGRDLMRRAGAEVTSETKRASDAIA